MKSFCNILIGLFFIHQALGQITLIPDSGFELYLVNTGIDTDGVINGQVLTSDIADETFLSIYAFTIIDMTGLEDFTSLEHLSLGQMDITMLDITQNLNLKELELDDININTLDISNNLNLEELVLNLGSSGIYPGTLTNLDLGDNVSLEKLVLNSVELASLDLSQNSSLEVVIVENLDTISSINLKSGFNELIRFLEIRGNPNLQCLQVDDPAGVIAGIDPPYNKWTIENDPTITDDCMLSIEESLIAQISMYPNPVNNMLTIDNTSSLKIIGVNVYDTKGRLILEENEAVSNLDVSSLTAGIFFITVETEKGSFTKKVVKN